LFKFSCAHSYHFLFQRGDRYASAKCLIIARVEQLPTPPCLRLRIGLFWHIDQLARMTLHSPQL